MSLNYDKVASSACISNLLNNVSKNGEWPQPCSQITEIIDYRGRNPKFLLSFPLEYMVSRYSIQSAIVFYIGITSQYVVLFPLSLFFMRWWCSTAKILVSVFNLVSDLLACYFYLVYDISPLFWIRCFVRNSILSFFICFLWRKNFVIVLNECLTCSSFAMYCCKDGGHLLWPSVMEGSKIHEKEMARNSFVSFDWHWWNRHWKAICFPIKKHDFCIYFAKMSDWNVAL